MSVWPWWEPTILMEWEALDTEMGIAWCFDLCETIFVGEGWPEKLEQEIGWFRYNIPKPAGGYKVRYSCE